MSLAVPAGLAAALLAVPLVVWYVLRSRRPRAVVASTYLWQRIDRAATASLPWQRFRPDRTFWLILLAILVGALALARPTFPVAAQLGDHTVLIIDASGSMLADEDGPTRAELARRAADEMVEVLGTGQMVSVIEAGSRARVVLSASPDPSAVRSALRSVRTGHAPADLADAFTLAAALERPGQETVIHVLTDGAIPPDALAAAPAGIVVTMVGQDRPNLAVTRLQALPAGAGAGQAFVQVRNFGVRPAEAVLEVAVDGAAIVEQPLRLAPRGTEDIVLPVSAEAGGEGLLTASIFAATPDAARLDALSIDDIAWAQLAGAREIRALIAGPGNLFLESALASVAGVEVSTAPAAPDDLAGVDLLVVDRIPAPAQPSVPTLYMAPLTAPDEISIDAAAPLELPGITFQDAEHALLADVDLSAVALVRAQRLSAPGLRSIAATPEGPLILAGRIGATPVVYVGFDLLESNLPLQVAWPVLAANTVSWLAGSPVTAPLTVGTQTVLPIPDGAEAAVVKPPSGPEIRLDPARPRVALDEVGVWRVRYEGDGPSLAEAPRLLTVNADPGEADLARDRSIVSTGGESDAAEVETAGARTIGRQILLAALALATLDALLSAVGWRPLRRPLRPRRAPS